MKILTDVHTHTTFSTDGISDIFESFSQACLLPLTYWGISEHFDYDYFVNGILFDGQNARFTKAREYFTTARKLQESCKKMHILVGGEFGFTTNRKVNCYYKTIEEEFVPDFVINSVHTNGEWDYYDRPAFDGKEKNVAYGEYLRLVRASLDAEYDYDVVGHICYPCRFAPYEDKVLHLNDFEEQLNDILLTIIQKDKILEVNSSVKGLKTPFIPFVDIVRRYFELGGRKVSFASDAHAAKDLCRNREQAMAALKKIGFEYITVPFRKSHIFVPIDE